MTSSQPARAGFGWWRNLGIRAASAVVLGVAAIGAVALGGLPFLAIIYVAAALLSLEWGTMSTPATPLRTSLAVALVVLVALVVSAVFVPRYGVIALAAGAAVATLILRSVTRRIGDVPFGAAYLGRPAIALIWLRSGDDGLDWTVLLLAVAWTADIAAFLVGSALKGPKLRPAFSPNKTWSGFFGALIAATAAGFVADALLDLPLPAGWALAVGLATGFATMAGDLWESWLKRRFGVKDSGDLIPGHGGLLDRVDGLLFAILAVTAARWLWETGALA
jgi:phosphatidate cytidylyltransferase